MADLNTAQLAVKSQVVTALSAMKNLSVQEKLALINASEQELLARDEAAKTHPFTGFTMSDKDWAQFRDHMTDGGGVTECYELGNSLVLRLFNGQQDPEFWPDLVHYLKACFKRDAHVRSIPGETGVNLSVAEPAVLTPMPAPAPAPAPIV